MLSGFPVSGAPISGLGEAGTLYPLERLCPGRNPRLVLDPDGGCLRQELHLFHLVEGGGLRRRSESGQFNTPHFTPETADDELRIEDAFRTSDRRVSVIYSERDALAGTLALKRIDSTPWPPFKAPPTAPRFTFTNPAWLPFYTGGLWWNPEGGAIVETATIEVTVGSGTVHAVELETSPIFPSGFEPVWPDHYEFTVGGTPLGPGFPAHFDIDLAHGGGTMNPCAFRARCRDDSDPLNPCYSPWRYYLAGYRRPKHPTLPPEQTVVLSYNPAPDDPLFNIIVCHPPDFTEGAGGQSVSMIYEEFFSPGVRLSSTCVEVYGYTPTGSPFLIRHDWLFLLRSHMPVSFQDETGRRFNFTLAGLVSADAGEGAPIFSGSTQQQPLDFE